MKKASPKANGAGLVEQFMQQLDHPLKDEVEMIRSIIQNADHEITEQIKWNAPSFSYHDEYLVTFNLRATDRVHLVFHNPRVAQVKSPLLEGDYPDRRMAYFSGKDDIEAKRTALEKAIKDLIKLQKK